MVNAVAPSLSPAPMPLRDAIGLGFSLFWGLERGKWGKRLINHYLDDYSKRIMPFIAKLLNCFFVKLCATSYFFSSIALPYHVHCYLHFRLHFRLLFCLHFCLHSPLFSPLFSGVIEYAFNVSDCFQAHFIRIELLYPQLGNFCFGKGLGKYFFFE